MATPNDLMGYGMPPFLSGELGNISQSVTAAGTSSTTAATALTEGHIVLVNGQSSQTGVLLPTGAKVGTPYFFVGTGNTAPALYPPSSGTINAATSLTLSAATATAIIIRTSTTQWYSFPLAP